VLRGPEPRRPIVAAGGEVVAQRRELDVPDGENVALVVAAGFADPDPVFRERKHLDTSCSMIIFNYLKLIFKK
jgi:hypothetical protein